MVTISQPDIDLFNAESITHDDIMAIAESVNSSERNQIAFAEKIAQQLGNPDTNRLTLGVALAILGKYTDALEQLEKAADSKEKFIEMAFCQRKTGQYDEALESIKNAKKNGEEQLIVNCEKANLCRLKRDFDSATETLKACQNAEGTSPIYHYVLARCLENQGQYDEAIKNYQTAVEINPNYSKALFHLAFLLDLRGDEEAAIDYYKQIIDSSSAYVNAMLNLAILYEDATEYEKAFKYVEQVLKYHPNNKRALLFAKDIKSSKTMMYDEEVEKSKDMQNKTLETPISDFELSVRSRNCLKKMNIFTIGDLLRITEAELLAYKNFGETSLNEIKEMLESKSMRLGMAVEGKMMLTPSQETMQTESNIDPELLSKSLNEFEMSVRARKCLEHLNIRTLGDLAAKTEAELLGVKNFGITSLIEIKQALETAGLGLRKLD